MDSEEIKRSKQIFSKKTKNINVIKNLTEIKDNVKILLEKNEEVIIKYLERFIYTSTLSETTKNEITEIFETIDSKLISE